MNKYLTLNKYEVLTIILSFNIVIILFVVSCLQSVLMMQSVYSRGEIQIIIFRVLFTFSLGTENLMTNMYWVIKVIPIWQLRFTHVLFEINLNYYNP